MKKGTTVSVLNDTLRGTVLFSDDTTVTFSDEHGFKHTYPKAEVVPAEDIFIEKTIPAKDNTLTKKRAKETQKYILDLHDKKLPAYVQALRSWEKKLEITKILHRFLDDAQSQSAAQVRIIHGIGDGIIQKIVYDCLSHRADVEFDDGGFFYDTTGYTDVFLRRN